ncbi:GMC oxidoreductase family protein [Pleurotus pulmonarius]
MRIYTPALKEEGCERSVRPRLPSSVVCVYPYRLELVAGRDALPPGHGPATMLAYDEIYTPAERPRQFPRFPPQFMLRGNEGRLKLPPTLACSNHVFAIQLAFLPNLGGSSLRGSIATSPTYDYVIIGGGTAGLAVANRLSEDPSVTVLVIEAGPNAEHLPEVFIPGLFGSGQALTTLNWGYATTPQPALNNRSLVINAGKVLGGSTTINAMLFPRAGRAQYDAWAELNRDASWGWDALLPFFRRSERVTPPDAFQINEGGITYDPEVHGSGEDGRVKVGYPNIFFEQSTLWRQAAVAAGFPGEKDLASGDPHGVGVSPESIDVTNYTRCSAACAYYTPFASRPNLNVITNATVTRIVWVTPSPGSHSGKGQKNLRAAAVEFLRAGSNRTESVTVGREVVVSAGTIGTPKVFELSGIGNSSILRGAGVTPILDLPSVGENLADHVHSYVSAFTNASLTFDALLADPNAITEQLSLWTTNHTGLLTSFPGSLGLPGPSNIFNNTGDLPALLREAKDNLDHFAHLFANGNPQLEKGIRAQHEISIRTPPEVDPAYYTHPVDAATHAAGINLARKTLTTPPMDSIYLGEFEPGSDVTSPQEISDVLRAAIVASDNHVTGTMAMMPKDLGGVVDTKLLVYGIDNVRVADASIIPIPVSAHTSSTVYMIGERAADIIKNSRGSA